VHRREARSTGVAKQLAPLKVGLASPATEVSSTADNVAAVTRR
jgi:hypothetical protein